MKTPIVHLETPAPMSASEGGLYALVAGALLGLGYLAGWTVASIRSTETMRKQELELLLASQRQPRRDNNPRPQQNRQNP